MLRIFTIFLICSCISIASAWTLVWEDEFKGTEIDTSKWSFEVGNIGGNHEMNYYTDRKENCFVKDGYLNIQALKESYKGFSYTSCRMLTRYKHEWLYGRFEARIKLPKGRGLWPAFWMLPRNVVWPKEGEIDIMENLGQDMKKSYSTVHYGAGPHDHKWKGSAYTLPEDRTLDDAFYVYRVDWYADYMVFTLDGNIVFSIRKDQIEDYEWWPFNSNQFFILLNLAVGGDWPGPPDDSTKFPALMIVDYVRVYKP